MLPIEFLFVILAGCAAIAVLILPLGPVRYLLVLAATFTAVAHGLLEGAHWQMIPAYGALVLLGISLWKGLEKRYHVVVVSSAPLFLAMSVLFSFLLPIFSLPKPTGPYPIGTTVLYLKDDSRDEDAAPEAGSKRELKVQLWYPAKASQNRRARYRELRETKFVTSYQNVIRTHSRVDAPVANTDAPLPVLFFSHSWQGRRTQDTFLTEELASHGYVVASIDYTYNASSVAFSDGRVIEGVAAKDISTPGISSPERIQKIWNKELLKWAADQRFVLDQLEAMNHGLGTLWYGRLNTHLAGAVGHSFGGAASVQACGEDRRIRAAVNLDGWFFGSINARSANQPLLVMNESKERPQDMDLHSPDPSVRVNAILDSADFKDTDFSLRHFGGYRVYVNGATHADFTDQPLISPLHILSQRGTLPAGRVHTVVRAYVLAFFNKTLRGEDPEILRDHTSPYAEVSFENWPTGHAEIVAAINNRD
jgi:dienelactone hydrolase